MNRRAEGAVLGLIIALYVILAGQYAILTPAWQAPDESAHYNYVRQIATDGALPVLEAGDWQQAYQNTLTASGFDPALLDRLDTVQYEDHQPPLYYLLQAPIYVLTDGDLVALRSVSVGLGVGVVVCTWAILALLFPRRPTLALTGAAFVAFIPQHLAILGSVSNDALAELIVALTLLVVVVYLGNFRDRITGPAMYSPRITPVILGVLVGVALWTKTTIYFLGGIVVLAVLLRWQRGRWPVRYAASHLAAVLIPALLLGGIWWGRNLAIYGGTDFFGLERHDEITVGQPRTDDTIATRYGGSTRRYLEDYAKTTFHSFWGQFGWMAVPMPGAIYRVLTVFTLAVGFGVMLFTRQHGWPRNLSTSQQDALIVFTAVLVLVCVQHVLYNREFVQFQGRYLYPALIPLSCLVALGLSGWVSLVEHRIPALVWAPVATMLGLALLAWYALETYLVPNLPAW